MANNESRERVGRLIVDADLDEDERQHLTERLDDSGEFSAEESTPMRIDVYRRGDDAQ